ncbi:MAG: transcriptional repressor [Pirellulaceae bacterium]|nr:transcriptional repressor [Pirellulaceae bacterium]
MLPGNLGHRIIRGMSTPAPVLAETTARARQILEQRGIRPTSQRLKVAEILLTSPRHLTAEQILATLRQSSGHVSKATVYNTLNLFVEQGLAREIHADPERCVYDSTMAPHHHFQNVDTGEMIDIRPEDLSFGRLPPLPPGTEIESVDVVIRVRRKG